VAERVHGDHARALFCHGLGEWNVHPLACQEAREQHADFAACAVLRVSNLLSLVSEVRHLTRTDPMHPDGRDRSWDRSYDAGSQLQPSGFAAVWSLGE